MIALFHDGDVPFFSLSFSFHVTGQARPLLLPLPVPLASSNLSSNGIEKLIDLHFGPLYPDYADHTRPVLIRQARDLLVCTFHGDLERFEAGFLRPAASIVGELKSSYLQGQVSEF
ncbi:hypothetical protein RP20_CCG020312 [Aedes albopictus]|nr:hypothetical protein RP20_CCG020312 [Aedes albopictus]